MITLDAIGLKHGTDKSSTFHDYLRFYEAILPARANPVNFLEIGVDGGASIRMWREWYNHPEGLIHGLDHNVKCWRPEPSDDPSQRIILHYGEQESIDRCRSLRGHGPFDVIIDDGGHHSGPQAVTFQELWRSVRPGGLYIVEDVHAAYEKAYVGDSLSIVQFFRCLIDEQVNQWGKSQCGKSNFVSPTDEEFEEIDTITFRRSLIIVRKK